MSFLDPLDNSVTCECTMEETDSSENSLHPDFAKVMKLTMDLHTHLSYSLLSWKRWQSFPLRFQLN